MSPCAEAPVLQGEALSYLVEPVGGSIHLDCVVHGDPVPSIRWVKDGLPLPGGRLRHWLQNGSLTIRRTKARRGLAPWGQGADLGDPGLFLLLRRGLQVGTVLSGLQSTFLPIIQRVSSQASDLTSLHLTYTTHSGG